MNKLDVILAEKQKEVLEKKAWLEKHPESGLMTLLQGDNLPVIKHTFGKALKKHTLSVIAEIKRRSPSKGNLALIENPVQLANLYAESGADAISILTDTPFFGGSLDDLRQVAQQENRQIPILRKDFIIDEIQIAEAVESGAAAVLLIVAVLGKKTRGFLDHVRAFGIEALVEVHTESEIELALSQGATIIGINNRDLTTFEIDTHRAISLVSYIPNDIIKVAESGILQPDLAKQYHAAGFDAVLIGEALVTSENPRKFIEACKQ